MTTDTKVLDRIRKLLAKAESTTHAEEAAAFTAKAQELMQRHAIDEALLASQDGKLREEITTIVVTIDYSPYQSPKEQLLHEIATATDCRAVFTAGYDRDRKTKAGGYQRVSRASITGYKSDLEFVELLYTSLLLQQESAFRAPDVQDRMFIETSHPGHRIKWRNSFAMSFADRIGQRMRQARAATRQQAQAEAPTGTSVALVLADRKALVDQAFNEKYPKLRTKHSSSGGYASGSAAGRAAGDRANLGGTGVGSSTKGALR